MTIKLIRKIGLATFFLGSLSMVSLSMDTGAEQFVEEEFKGCFLDDAEDSVWFLSVDHGSKELGKYTPFVTLEAKNHGAISKIRIDICPNSPIIANRFANETYQNKGNLAMSCQSSFLLCGKVKDKTELDKFKGIIHALNAIAQAKFDEEKALGKKEDAEKGETFSLWNYTTPCLPFTFIENKNNPEDCFYAALDFSNHRYIEGFFQKFQILYPELKSEMFYSAYSMIKERA